jgi:hypothetical protein
MLIFKEYENNSTYTFKLSNSASWIRSLGALIGMLFEWKSELTVNMVNFWLAKLQSKILKSRRNELTNPLTSNEYFVVFRTFKYSLT